MPLIHGRAVLTYGGRDDHTNATFVGWVSRRYVAGPKLEDAVKVMTRLSMKVLVSLSMS